MEYNNFNLDGLDSLDVIADHRCPLLGLIVDRDAIIDLLIGLIEEGFEQTDCKLKLLKWMVDFRPLKSVFFSKRFQSSCASFLYHECVDPEFITKCLRKYISLDSLRRAEDVKVLEHLLHHARLYDFHLRSRMLRPTSVTDECIRCLNFQLVPPSLKYEDTVYYTENCYHFYKSQAIELGFFHTRQRYEKGMRRLERRSRFETQTSKLRISRMLQIFYCFRRLNYCDRSDALEAIRLVWSSIPDSFISLREVNEAFEHVISTQFLKKSHAFYEEAIRRTVSGQEPRSMAQFCRTVIRKRLFISAPWLPDGIKQLQLPPRLKSFLNLEIDNLHQHVSPAV